MRFPSRANIRKMSADTSCPVLDEDLVGVVEQQVLHFDYFFCWSR
jgi:hypothetical protein